MNRSEFEARLKKTYKGAVQSLNKYVNNHATLCFKCSDCGLVFFGKPIHMIGKEYQQHKCNYPYGDKNGERLSSVGFKKKPTKKKESFNIDQLNKMIWEDYTWQQIASELKINPVIVKDYFEKEGLI